jgi:hypothetical protein
VSTCPLFSHSFTCIYNDLTSTLDCYVTADQEAFAAANKAYIGEEIYDEDKVGEYINSISETTATWDASKVLRIGWCASDYELLIPKAMLGAPTKRGGSGPLVLNVHCYASLDAMRKAMKKVGLGESPEINFGSFHPAKKSQ